MSTESIKPPYQHDLASFVPETLQQCREHYVPTVEEYVGKCSQFGNPDGLNGRCWWCMEMTPYAWHMCHDESWIKSLMSPLCRRPVSTREEAMRFIEDYKQKHPLGNERRAIESEVESMTKNE